MKLGKLLLVSSLAAGLLSGIAAAQRSGIDGRWQSTGSKHIFELSGGRYVMMEGGLEVDDGRFVFDGRNIALTSARSGVTRRFAVSGNESEMHWSFSFNTVTLKRLPSSNRSPRAPVASSPRQDDPARQVPEGCKLPGPLPEVPEPPPGQGCGYFWRRCQAGSEADCDKHRACLSAVISRGTASTDPPLLRCLDLKCTAGDARACDAEATWRWSIVKGYGHAIRVMERTYGSDWIESFGLGGGPER